MGRHPQRAAPVSSGRAVARAAPAARRAPPPPAAASPAGETAAAPPPPSSGPPQEIVRISPALLAAGGLDPCKESPANVAAFSGMLSDGFLLIQLDHPGLRILNIDPPVLTVDGLLPPDACDDLIAAARASGRMAQSRVGSGAQLSDASIRTSSTLAITKDALAGCEALRGPLRQVLAAAAGLLGPGVDAAAITSMQFSRPAGPTQLAPELPQVAHYLPGEGAARFEGRQTEWLRRVWMGSGWDEGRRAGGAPNAPPRPWWSTGAASQ